ncbi:MAG TPA: succinate dehydrogenase iron-sulfur subunit [Nitrospiraceae bacterium]|jgi:succinate dehydrogenase / fumarate reductase iron-sulfur subunit|nr:succinate dehydrogenase iron-sulfur subunit [Nitrospiraceae bacterium]
MRLTFTIRRFNPEIDPHPHDEDYRLEVGRGTTVLDGLIRIKNEQDGTLSFRYSCRSAICGSCAMTINGHEKLACRTSVRKELERHGDITVQPLRNLSVIKDLVVDMASFWDKVRAVEPWLSGPADGVPHDEGAQSALVPGTYDFHNVDACIMCGACVAACTSHEVSKGFLGPAALAKADRFLEDPREPDAGKRQRLLMLDHPDGMWDCVRCNFCVQVCPKDVKPMEAIVRLRRAAIERGLTASEGARHITGFTEIVEHEGRLNEARMPLKIVGFNLKRLLHVLPLGLRMLLKGKVPSPFAPAIPGIAGVRAIFAARRAQKRSS